MMQITYHGHSCLSLTDGATQIVIDPFLTGNPKADRSADDFDVHAVLLTHGHSDHMADAIHIARRCDVPIIANFEIAQYCSAQGVRTEGMNIGGSKAFPGFQVKYVHAFHTSSIETPNGFADGGQPAGILVRMGERCFYHAGDTGLFGDMQWIGRRHGVDAVALPIGDYFTMGPDDALTAAEWIGARHVIPVHYNTFDLIAQDADAFVKGLGEMGLLGHALQPGESLTLE